jgi:hypothetical protein
MYPLIRLSRAVASKRNPAESGNQMLQYMNLQILLKSCILLSRESQLELVTLAKLMMSGEQRVMEMIALVQN